MISEDRNLNLLVSKVLKSNLLICIQQMSEHIIHLYGVFNNTISEIPTRGDNAGCSCNMILKTSIFLGVNKFLIGIILHGCAILLNANGGG